MTDLQAAIGREQLKRLPDIVARRRQLADLYRQRLEGILQVVAPREPEWARSNWQSFCIGLSEGVDQSALMQALLDTGIATRRGIMNIHQEASYGNLTASQVPGGLSRSEHARDHSVILPLSTLMSEEDVDTVVGAIETQF